MALKPKFYTDVHISKVVVKQLREKGVDIIHSGEVGKSDDSDTDHLTYCGVEGRTLMSFDSDYITLHSQWLNEGKFHAGIIKLSETLQGERGIGRIVAVVLRYHEAIVHGNQAVESLLYNQLHYER